MTRTTCCCVPAKRCDTPTRAAMALRISRRAMVRGCRQTWQTGCVVRGSLVGDRTDPQQVLLITERNSLIHPDILEAIEVQAVNVESRHVRLPSRRRGRITDEYVRRVVQHRLLNLLVQLLPLLRVLF